MLTATIQAVKTTVNRVSYALSLTAILTVAYLAHTGQIHGSYHLSAGNDDIAQTEIQHDARVQLSATLPTQAIAEVKVPGHKPKVK